MLYFNEHDPYAAQWLQNLWPEARVEGRSIADLRARDLPPAVRCHFFAGIGGWEYALELAGWPADREVWTGSCPCQPFSVAGKGKGNKDPRHLWPEFRRLIAVKRPATIIGEQVASRLGRGWLAGVRADLEALDYAVGAADLCAASAGAPHIRQRLFWVADASNGDGWSGERSAKAGVGSSREWRRGSTGGRATGGVAHSDGGQSGHGDLQRSGEHGQRTQDGGIGRLADPHRQRRAGLDPLLWPEEGGPGTDPILETAGGSAIGWNGANVWLLCSDGKARRTQSGLFPLAYGVPSRMGRLRAYGNAIVPQVAAVFIRAFLDTEKKVA